MFLNEWATPIPIDVKIVKIIQSVGFIGIWLYKKGQFNFVWKFQS